MSFEPVTVKNHWKIVKFFTVRKIEVTLLQIFDPEVAIF